jgi:hypothetical protein
MKVSLEGQREPDASLFRPYNGREIDGDSDSRSRWGSSLPGEESHRLKNGRRKLALFFDADNVTAGAEQKP